MINQLLGTKMWCTSKNNYKTDTYIAFDNSLYIWMDILWMIDKNRTQKKKKQIWPNCKPSTATSWEKAVNPGLVLNCVTLVTGICWHYWLPVLLTVNFLYYKSLFPSSPLRFLFCKCKVITQSMWIINVAVLLSTIHLSSGYNVNSSFYAWVVYGRATEESKWQQRLVAVVTVRWCIFSNKFDEMGCFYMVLESCDLHQFEIYLWL